MSKILLPVVALLILAGCGHPISKELAVLGFQVETGEKSCTLTGKGGKFTFRPGSRAADFNGTLVHLTSEAFLDGSGRYAMVELDIRKVLLPLMERETHPVKTVLLDPGHGGRDFGTVGKVRREKDLNLELAKTVKRALEKRGFTALLTREDDRYLTLEERAAESARRGADLFISIHHNASASGNAGTRGVETYALTPAGAVSTADKPDPAANLSERPGNRFDAAGLCLAYLIQTGMRKAADSPDRGVRFARFRVLTLAECPAVLVEAGFVSNAEEEMAAGTEARQKAVAEAIAEAVKKINLKK